MKTRLGFVSNSSSSSFMVVSDESDPKKIEFSINFTLNELLWSPNIISSKEELNKWFFEEHSWKEKDLDELLSKGEEYMIKDYHNLLSYIEKGKTIIDGSVSNDGGPLGNLIYEQEANISIPDGCEIIQGY